jgi:hypothetical protein
MQSEKNRSITARIDRRERIVLRDIQGMDGSRSLVRLKPREVVVVCGEEDHYQFVPVQTSHGKFLRLHTTDLSEGTRPLLRAA